jgi:AcrR family transcriptional regulator
MAVMARWEPNARERLISATIDLFAEQGYDKTSVNEIAARAGLTKTTFFRHFRDKREVLFVGQELFVGLLAEGIAAAPPEATPLGLVEAALDNVTTVFTAGQRAWAPRLAAVIEAHPDLRERAASKRAAFATAMNEALRKRGVPELTAQVAAELGSAAFHRAYEQWTALPNTDATFPALARQALHDLRTAATTLT